MPDRPDFWIQSVVFGNRNDNYEPAPLASPCHGQNHVQYGATICFEEAHQSVSSDESSGLRNEYLPDQLYGAGITQAD